MYLDFHPIAHSLENTWDLDAFIFFNRSSNHLAKPWKNESSNNSLAFIVLSKLVSVRPAILNDPDKISGRIHKISCHYPQNSWAPMPKKNILLTCCHHKSNIQVLLRHEGHAPLYV